MSTLTARTLERLGPQPPNFERIAALNRGALLTTGVEAAGLDANEARLKLEQGALAVDVRADLQFDDGHIRGAVCLASCWAGFGSKLAWLALPDREVVFVCRDDADGRRAASLAFVAAVRQIAGFLSGGMTIWHQERQPLARTERIAAKDPARWLAADPGLQLLDVRERHEWQSGHVSGSLFAPWRDITELPAGVDPTRPIAVICAGGIRAATGASLLKRHGAREVVHVVDGGVSVLAQEGVVLEADSETTWPTPTAHRAPSRGGSFGSPPGHADSTRSFSKLHVGR